eukprot:6181520-Pleurochrysis_carterae.AAC.4
MGRIALSSLCFLEKEEQLLLLYAAYLHVCSGKTLVEASFVLCARQHWSLAAKASPDSSYKAFASQG